MKTEWLLFKKSIDELINLNLPKKEIEKKWLDIKTCFKNYKPNHLIAFLHVLKEKNISKNSKILDHGCGGGYTLFFLAINGYDNLYGIDINSTKEFYKKKNLCNKIFKIILNTKENVIQNYDGRKIPFKNDFFDFIYSQQVIEHVKNNLLDDFLSEEKRILKKVGFALHQIPHRLGPFEGHTKKWFIHWLPKNIYHYILKDDNIRLNLVKNALFLKWPWQLNAYFNKYFDQVNNISYMRLKYNVASGEYSKKEDYTRKVLIFLFNLPIFGNFLLKTLSIFFQLEVLVNK